MTVIMRDSSANIMSVRTSAAHFGTLCDTDTDTDTGTDTDTDADTETETEMGIGIGL